MAHGLTDDLVTRLKNKPQGLALYVHLPFCKKKCGYCDFYSLPAQPYHLIAVTVKEICAELAWYSQNLHLSHCDTVYIGGGTPSWLPVNLLSKLLAAIKPYTSSATEWTIEANPESLNKEFLKLCRDFGVNRVSLGVQSFSYRLLRILERDCSKDSLQKACELICSFWPGDVNIDLIYAIPTQRISELEQDLTMALSLRPQHLSCYRLTLNKKTSLGQRIKAKTDDIRWEEALSRLIWDHLKRNGYRHYEISNYCLPKKFCRHNLHYWLLDPYLGIGPAGVSTLPLCGGSALRLEKPFNLKAYLIQGWREATKTELITPKSLLLEHLLMGLRLKKGIELKKLQSRFPNLGLQLSPLFLRWEERGLIKKTPGRISCRYSGLRILNVLLREAAGFIAELKELNTNWP